MTRRTSIVSAVGSYFASKGGVMTMQEYKSADDAPVRFVLIKRTIGSWGRLINMIGDLSNYSIEVTIVEDEPNIENLKPAAKPEVKPVVEKTKGA
jgi:hypothetical protein